MHRTVPRTPTLAHLSVIFPAVALSSGILFVHLHLRDSFSAAWMCESWYVVCECVRISGLDEGCTSGFAQVSGGWITMTEIFGDAPRCVRVRGQLSWTSTSSQGISFFGRYNFGIWGCPLQRPRELVCTRTHPSRRRALVLPTSRCRPLTYARYRQLPLRNPNRFSVRIRIRYHRSTQLRLVCMYKYAYSRARAIRVSQSTST